MNESIDASVMFPSATPAAAAEPTQAVPRPSTDEELGRALYQPIKTYAGLHAGIQEFADGVGYDSQTVDSMHDSAANMFADLGVSVPDANEWLGLLLKHTAEPVAADQVATWNKEIRSELRQRYGSAEADNRLAKVQQLIAKHPDFSVHLAETGLGSHPKIVMALVDRANR